MKVLKKIEKAYYASSFARKAAGIIPIRIKVLLLRNILRKIGVVDGVIKFDEIRKLIKREDPVILEIGANNGADTNRFAETFPKGRIYCFEPDPRAVAKWRKNVTAPNAELDEVVICDRNGMLPFHQSGGGQKAATGTSRGQSERLKSIWTGTQL